MADEYDRMEVDEQQDQDDGAEDDEAFEAADEEVEEDDQQDEESKESEEAAEVCSFMPTTAAATHGLCCTDSSCCLQEDAVEVAKSEKERLKQQMQHKKQLVEKMRTEQNAMAEAGEVGPSAPTACSSTMMLQPRTCSSYMSLCLQFPADRFHNAAMQEARTQNRLQFLLRQAEIFQHFAPASAVEKAKKKYVVMQQRPEYPLPARLSFTDCNCSHGSLQQLSKPPPYTILER